MNKVSEEKEAIELVYEEKDPKIVEPLLNHLKEDEAALALIGSYRPAKITPSKVVFASLRLQEELNLEDAILKIKERGVSKILFLVNCSGGSVQSSFMCAQLIRNSFKQITVFVPHIAVSGGTLMALTGNKIIMGGISHMSPIDVQLERQGTLYSVNAMVRSFGALNNLFKTVAEEDAPYPWKAMANKLDPVEFQEWVDAARLMEMHALTILQHQDSSFKERAQDIVTELTAGYPTHEYAITFDEAKEKLGDVVSKPDNLDLWNVMRTWLRKYINTETSGHIIRYVLPKPKPEKKKGEA